MIDIKIKSNIDAVSAKYKNFEQAIPKAVQSGILSLYDFIGLQATSKYMRVHTLSRSQQKTGIRTAGKNPSSKLRIVTRRLSDSIRRIYNFRQDGAGKNESFFKLIKKEGIAFIAQISSLVPYAFIQEKGGTINHTNLFGRGIAANIRIPARPYMAPAAKEGERKASAIFDQALEIATRNLK